VSRRLQRQIIVYAVLVGLSIPYRVISGPLSSEAFGGLIFMIFLAGVGTNHLLDQGYKIWAVVVIGVSFFLSVSLFFGLMKYGFLISTICWFLAGLPAGLTMYFSGPKPRREVADEGIKDP